ncbi:MAG: hypothetical protein ACYTEQ_12215 [Planctomycetota bacterium]|jgi:hypothetical protein
MAATKYTYSISGDTANGIVNSSSLNAEIDASAIVTSLSYIETSGNVLDIWFVDALSGGDETILDGVVAAHTGEPPLPGPVETCGGQVIVPLSTPAAPTVAQQGASGETSWGYKVSAVGPAGETLASSATTISDGNATLDGTNFNRVSWVAVPFAIEYRVYRTTAGGTPSSTGLMKSTVLLTVDDTGLTASGAEPSEDMSSSLTVGSGSASPSKLVTIRELTSDYQTVTSLLNLIRQSSGTVAAGFGTGAYVALEDTGGVLRAAGALHILWADPGAALDADFRVMLRDAGSVLQERLRVTSDGRVQLSTVEVMGIGTCRAVLPVDGGVRGGTTSGSSNNEIAAVKFDTGTDGWNRYNMKPPANYTSGDLVFRLICSVPTTIAASKGTRWKLEWSLKSLTDALGSWGYTNEYTYDISSQVADVLFAIDFAITAAQFNKTKDMLPFKITRVGTDSADDCGVDIYVHGMELRYTGYLLAGQAGQ